MELTPKGLNVPGVTKPVLLNVASQHTIFRFLKLFVKMHLGISFT
jgi:hypothetical protein